MDPQLTVKALAEFIELPAYKQLDLLSAQKYPDQSPAIARIPYYQTALVSIRTYYSSDNDGQVIRHRVDDLHSQLTQGGLSPQKKAKLANNISALKAFQKSSLRKRDLVVKNSQTYKVDMDGVTIKFTPDLIVEEDSEGKHLLFNLRATPLETDLARRTVELASWVLLQNDEGIPPSHIELLELTSDRIISFNKMRRATIKRAQQNAKVVKALWASL
jgi:hypothetical protein